MKTELKNLRQLLFPYDNGFYIPDYQRPYEWEEKHVEELLEDIIFNFNQPGDEDYFLSTMVFAARTGNMNTIHHIIDGQQRLTTLIFKHHDTWSGYRGDYHDDVNSALYQPRSEANDRPEDLLKVRMESVILC